MVQDWFLRSCIAKVSYIFLVQVFQELCFFHCSMLHTAGHFHFDFFEVARNFLCLNFDNLHQSELSWRCQAVRIQLVHHKGFRIRFYWHSWFFWLFLTFISSILNVTNIPRVIGAFFSSTDKASNNQNYRYQDNYR